MSSSNSNSRSFSPSQKSFTRNFTLQYEPTIYCKCGLKSPLCTTRESGSKFFGCQQWKENGCGYLVLLDDLISSAKSHGISGSTETCFEELKAMIEDVRVNMLLMRADLDKVKQKLHSNDIQSGSGLKMVKVLVVVVVVGLGILVCLMKNNVKNSHLPCLL